MFPTSRFLHDRQMDEEFGSRSKVIICCVHTCLFVYTYSARFIASHGRLIFVEREKHSHHRGWRVCHAPLLDTLPIIFTCSSKLVIRNGLITIE